MCVAIMVAECFLTGSENFLFLFRRSLFQCVGSIVIRPFFSERWTIRAAKPRLIEALKKEQECRHLSNIAQYGKLSDQ
jgi:hypothetical protein